MASPHCEVKNGSAAYVTSVGGVNVTALATVVIRLASLDDVDSWTVPCITTDDLSVVATVNSGVVIDSVLKTATLTAPTSGRALRFRSTANGGVDRNGVSQASLVETFVIYTLTPGGLRVHALDETLEGSSLTGWGADVNALIRAGGASSVTLAEVAVNTTLVHGTHYGIVSTVGGLTHTLPASPSNGDSYEVHNLATTTITVNGGGHNIGPSTTEQLGQYDGRIYRYSSTSGIWVRA